MSQITNDNYKPSLFDEDELAHYGVKGMRWGVRRTPEQLGRARSQRKQNRKQKNVEIKDARARVQSRGRQYNRQIDAVNLAEHGKKQAEEYLKLEKMAVDMLKDPDQDMALRMTSGEKAATAAIALLAPGVGTAVAVGMVGGNVVQKWELDKQRRKAGV